MKKYVWLGVLCICLSVLSVWAETDRILMRVGGEDITLSEAEYYYRRSGGIGKDIPRHFLNHFLYYKLKVADAQSRGWDTLACFRQQCEILQGEVLKNLLTDEQKFRELCQMFYEKEQDRLGLKNWMKIRQVDVLLPQHASSMEVRMARNRIDSVYSALVQGKKWEEVKMEYASAGIPTVIFRNDKWVPLISVANEIAGCLQSLPEGIYSAPFHSPAGIHIVRSAGSKMYAAWEDIYPWVRFYLEKPENWARIVDGKRYRQWLEGGQKINSEYVGIRLKEIHDGLLVAYWDEVNPIEASAPEAASLERFFEEHKKEYRWEFPHFKGAVIHCLNKKAGSKIKKILKRLPQKEWENALKEFFSADSSLCYKMECGLFQIGKNAYVDKLVFKCGEFVPDPALPYTFVVGKKLKKGPEDCRDVYEEVLRDYLFAQREKEVKRLMERFKAEINPYVLKTVNCSGSN